MRFKIRETTYNAASLYSLSLRQILQLEMETKDFGRELHLADIQALTDELDAISDPKKRGASPAATWVLAVTIWATRNLAGEKITFEQAVDFPMDQLTILPEPEDHRQGNPTKGRPRKGSGPAVKRAPANAATKTSNRTSTSG